MVHAKIVRNFARVGHIEDREVCEFANFKRADAVVATKRIGCVDGSRGEGFGGRHVHLSAGQGENHGHRNSGTGARVEIRGERHDGAGVNELARGPVMGETEMEAAAGEHGAGDVRSRESANVGSSKFLEVVRARGVHLNGEARCPGAGELFGVKTQTEAAGASGGEDFAGLRNRKSAAVAEDIAEFGEIFSGDARKPFAADEVDVGFGRFAGAIAKFSGDDMSAQKCRDDFETLLAVEFADEREDFAFTEPVEAIAGFGFECGGSVGGELREMRERAGFEMGGRSGAKFADAVENAAACAGDFLVGGAGDALFVFSSARARMNKMRVRIDEAGNDNASSEIEFACAAGFGQPFDRSARANGGDATVANQKRAVGDDARVSKRAAAARRRTAKRENLRAIGEQLIQRATRVGHFQLDVHGTEKRGEVQ